MTDYLFSPAPVRSVPVEGETARYPVSRVFCVGRNYAAHAIEMGDVPDREAPFYFTKSPSAVLASGSAIAYPPGTEDFHYEMELTVALGTPVFRASLQEAAQGVYAYGCGLDMTRRDLQAAAKKRARPWDLGKDVEGSAVLAPMTRAQEFVVADQRISLSVNGIVKQDAALSDMIHSVPEVIAHLSGYYHLQPGDVILTGTPSGVGPVVPGDQISGQIDGLQPITLSITQPE